MQNLQTPLNTSYAWDISHALVTTYHPYSHSPSALTEYLKQKLHSQRAKRLGRSLPAQVEPNIQPERNINSDFALATTTLDYLERRGERNVPKRYLKDADWCEDGPLGTGYYVADSDDPSTLIAIDFNFKHLQWGCTHPKKDKFVVERPAPIRYGLRIFDEERTQDRSQWGPIDGAPEEDETPNPHFKFGSEAGGDTPDPDVIIFNSQKKKTESRQSPNSSPPTLANHPSNLDHWLEQWHKSHPQPRSPTVWWPEPWELEYPKEETPPVQKEYSEPFSPAQHNRGDGSGDDPPEPHQRDTGKRKEGGSGGGGGGDDPDNSGGGGGGGGGPDPAGGANPADPGALSDKMIGKEPDVFTGDRDKVEEFMTSWSVYQGINKQTRVMNNPMSQTMLFFGYLRGPKMHLWIKKISAQLAHKG